MVAGYGLVAGTFGRLTDAADRDPAPLRSTRPLEGAPAGLMWEKDVTAALTTHVLSFERDRPAALLLHGRPES